MINCFCRIYIVCYQIPHNGLYLFRLHVHVERSLQGPTNTLLTECDNYAASVCACATIIASCSIMKYSHSRTLCGHCYTVPAQPNTYLSLSTFKIESFWYTCICTYYTQVS